MNFYVIIILSVCPSVIASLLMNVLVLATLFTVRIWDHRQTKIRDFNEILKGILFTQIDLYHTDREYMLRNLLRYNVVIYK